MMNKLILAAAAAWLMLTGAAAQAGEKEITIGFLSWNGPFKGMRQWGATGDYLAEQLGRPVTVRPLDFKEVLPAAASGTVDFFTADPAMFVIAKREHGAEAVLTMKNTLVGTDQLGAVIFTAAENSAVNGLTNLKGKKFGALRRRSFAGWQMAEKEFLDAGLEPYTYLSTLRFFENPQAVAKAVLSRQIDAGTMPTGLLEQLAAEGALRLDDVKILEQKFHPDFPYLCSTLLYPSFPLARTAGADEKLGRQIAAALKALPPDHPVLLDSGISGWVDPLDYAGVEQVLGQLKGGLPEQ